MPGSILEVCDPKLGAAVKIAIWQRQNLYLRHIGSDRRIFSQDPHPMSCKMGRRGPSYVPSIKIYMFLNLLTWGVFGVRMEQTGEGSASSSRRPQRNWDGK